MLDNYNNEMAMNALDALNAAINALDANGEYGNGDTLYELMAALRNEWGMEDE